MGGWRLRLTILVGFALTFGIWIFAGLYFGRRIARLETDTARISDRYVQSQQLLNSARSQILLSSVYVRDALLDASTAAAVDGLTRVGHALGSADASLADYVPILDSPVELPRIERLRLEIDDLRTTTRLVLEGAATGSARDARMLLRTRIMPKRELVVGIAEELGTLNRTGFVTHQRETAALYRQAQVRIWQVLGLALAASLGVATIAIRQAGELERRERLRHAKDLELQQDLRRLSARLLRVREQERRSLARELHDEIGQLMTAVKMELSSAQHAIETQGGSGSVLDGTRPLVEQALQSVRDLSHLLHPSVLDDLGLVAATEWFIKTFRTRHGLEVEFEAQGLTERLDLDTETAAYRIVQEALTNVARHAHASRAQVSMVAGDQFTVTIVDDGIGYRPKDSRTSGAHAGLGLVSMQERATNLGGHVTITTRPSRGTIVEATLPVRWRRANTSDEHVAAADLLSAEDA